MEENQDKITVQTSLLPFNQHFETLELEKCTTIQEIINKLAPINFQDCKLIVTVNNEIVEREKWSEVKLKKGDLVGVNFIPMGGGGGNKALQIGIMIAVIAVAAWAAPLAVGALGLAEGTLAAAFVEGAVYVGVGMVGSVVSNALLSTPKQGRGSTSSIKESQTSFIEGSGNTINKYGVVPVNLGTNRMFPPQAALPYNETSGNNQYVRQLFTYGYGKLIVGERKLGETNLEQFKEVEYEDRLNADLNQGTNLYTNAIYQENFNINVTQEAGYIIRTTQKDTLEAELDITFQGLMELDDSGERNLRTVSFEVQWAPTGTQNWSTSLSGFTVENSQTIEVDLSHTRYESSDKWQQYENFIILDCTSGSCYSIRTGGRAKYGVRYPSLPEGHVILGYIDGYEWYEKVINPDSTGLWDKFISVWAGGHNWVDLRQSLVGPYIKSMDDFKVSYTAGNAKDTKVTIGPGEVTYVSGSLVVSAATSQALRKVKHIGFPEPGQYDIRIRRLTEDSTSDRIVDVSYWTALRSIRKPFPPVKFADISGTAMRIKATDQLSGSVDSYNCLVTTLVKSYNPELNQWEDNTPSSNPADLFRYVLQSPAFAKRVSDDKIDLEKLQEWWVYCDSLNLTYDRVIDYDTSIDDVLNDICAAGVATLCKVYNRYSVIIDNERPIIKGLVTPRNSWDYNGSIIYPEIPHALRVEFRNEEVGYETDERIVYADGYNESNATLYERLQFPSCIHSDLAYWYGRRYFATALLQPETHTFKMDFEHMTFNRGDRISLVNDVILVGVGQGRIKELLVDNVDNPTIVQGFTIDDELDIPPAVNLGTRIRDNNAKEGYKYHLLQPVEGRTGQFAFATPIPYNEAPVIGSLCAFVEDGKELDLIITGIKSDKNQAATITAIDYAPARFDPIGEIPPFESNITLGLDFYRPLPPVQLGEIQTDESVMVRNSDGSLISVAVIPLINRNENNVNVLVKAKLRESTEWFIPGALKKDPDEVVITGLQDGEYYDFDIRYQRQTGLELISDSLMLENIKFIGGSNPPQKVRNFRVTVTNGLGFFEWSPNDDVDISHYEIRFSYETEGATWENSQVVTDKITATSFTNIIHKGIYLIKAIDLLGNESLEASTIISIDSGAFKNVIEELIQDPLWLGVKDNTINESGVLAIDDDTKTEGFYYFNPDIIDLGDVYECSLTANIRSGVEKRSRIRDIDETLKMRDLGPIRDFGAEWDSNADWFVHLEMNISYDGETWNGWEEFIASQIKFRAIKFRLHLWSENVYITPRVSIARVIVDMPDRYESREDVEIEDPDVGAVVEYDQAFWNNPAVNITVQDGAVDDRIEFIVKNNKGFTFKVFNATLNTYVKRSFDFLAAGYGRIVKQ